MHNFLKKISQKSYDNPWLTIGIWLVLLSVLGFGAYTYFKPMNSAITIPGTEAQKTIDKLDEIFPESGSSTGRIALKTKDGSKISKHETDITKMFSDISSVKGVSKSISPFESKDTMISKDGNIAYGQIQLKENLGSIDKETIESVENITKKYSDKNLEVERGAALINNVPSEIIGMGELVGVIFALAVLAMTFASIVAAGMPIIVAVLSVGLTTAGLFSLSQILDINSTTPVMSIMLGLAVGIDYSLFIINKYIHYVKRGYSMRDSIIKANETAGNAVVFAATTVFIALSALTIVNIPFLSIMGLVGAIGVAMAAIVAVTTVPALMRLCGVKIFHVRERKAIAAAVSGEESNVKESHKISKETFWSNWARFIVRNPIKLILGSIVIVGFIAYPILDIKLGLPSDEYANKTTTERKSYDIVAEGFGAGYNAPLSVLIEKAPKVTEQDKQKMKNDARVELDKKIMEKNAQAQNQIAQKLAQAQTPQQQQMIQQQAYKMREEGNKKREEAVNQINERVDKYAKFTNLKDISDKIKEIDNVKDAFPAAATDNGENGIIQVIPKTAPSDQKTIDLINYLRSNEGRDKIKIDDNKPMLSVTGNTAMQNDINKKLTDALPVYIAIIVGLSLIVLIIAFHSLLVPLKATLGFVFSVLAMFGALVAVFQWGWFGIADAPGPIISFIPIIATGILFGLAMDYEFFIMSGIHEESHYHKSTKKAVEVGFAQSAKVVTAAALIMTGVFSGFVSNSDSTVQAIGFGLAVGVMIDAFIIRMTIIPALTIILGKASWWMPKWLEKITPKISIEGSDK